jgi:hypothetical protein
MNFNRKLFLNILASFLLIFNTEPVKKSPYRTVGYERIERCAHYLYLIPYLVTKGGITGTFSTLRRHNRGN